MNHILTDTHIHMGCRTIGAGHEHNWQPLLIKDFEPSQNKMFFVFGGNTTNYPDAANGNAKIIERLLFEEKRNKSNIYSFLYEEEPISSSSLCLRHKYLKETHALFETIFKPLLCDKSVNIKEKQGIERVLNNIVFVSHCGGSMFVDIIIDDIYDTLLEKYHPSIVEQLVSKIQYFSYAPHELPTKNVNGFIITPFLDNNYAWSKVLATVKDERIYTDYPKGSTKMLLKASSQGNVRDTFHKIFSNEQLIICRANQYIYLIPSRLNSDIVVGDHSIECLVKSKILDAGTPYADTARIVNYASKLVINQFASNNCFDHKRTIDKIVEAINECRTNNSYCKI